MKITSRKQEIDGYNVGTLLFNYLHINPLAKPKTVQKYFINTYGCDIDAKLVTDAKYDVANNRIKRKDESCIKQMESKRQKAKTENVTSEELDDALSALDKAVEKLHKRGVNVKIDYNAIVNTHIPKRIEPFTGGDKNNVLVIPDLHTPCVVDGFLDFVREQQERFNCGTVVYIGDIVDFNSISYHEKIPEILNPKGEIDAARSMLKDWYYTFPEATVLLGNHCLLVYRQARSAGLLREFIKDPNIIFEAPIGYKFVNEKIINNVLYTHGTNGNAFKKCVNEGMSLVQGHLHTQGGVQYHRSRQGQIFGMQVGTGIDFEQVNFDYAKTSAKKAILSCGVVLKQGDINLPIVIPMI